MGRRGVWGEAVGTWGHAQGQGRSRWKGKGGTRRNAQYYRGAIFSHARKEQWVLWAVAGGWNSVYKEDSRRDPDRGPSKACLPSL